MEKTTFYLPCGNNLDDMPPSFEGFYDPSQRWNGWVCPKFTKEIFDKIVEYYQDEKTNTAESIAELKEFCDPITSKTKWNVSMHGALYDFGSSCLCWAADELEDKDNMGTVYLMEQK
tara:strand:- start:327 stop:677 length:351 start_codon:yes stop_codon:yes gene_type:complete